MALVIVVLASVAVGPGDILDPELGPAFARLRALRAAGAGVAGAALAVAGVLAQALFRNPLASPSVLGATAGASFGGQLSLLALGTLGGIGGLEPELWVPLGCFGGAWLAVLVVIAVARRRRDELSLLLVGFVSSAVFLSAASFVTSLAQDRWEVGRAVISFALGGVTGVGPLQIGLSVPLVIAGLAVVAASHRILDVLTSGEDEARALGVPVASVVRWSAIWIAVLVGAAVSISGNLGFVGLIAPHAARTLVGPSHRRLVPAAVGFGFLVACDALVRVVPSRSEIPLGVITSLLGAPVFLHLLMSTRRSDG